MNHTRRSLVSLVSLPAWMLLLLLAIHPAEAAGKHSVYLGPVHMNPYSAEGDPSGARAGETRLAVRALMADGKLKDWTTGEMHEVTDRTFVVRQAVRMNDALPGQKGPKWVWQRGPWLLVNRDKGSASILHLPDFEPAVSDVVWFRDLGAYCGADAGGKQRIATVYRIGERKALLSKKLTAAGPGACAPAVWEKQPLSVTFAVEGGPSLRYEIPGSSAEVLTENTPGR